MTNTTNTYSAEYVAALVEYLNGTRPRFVYLDAYIPTVVVNLSGAQLIRGGRIIETPGDPYTYRVAE